MSSSTGTSSSFELAAAYLSNSPNLSKVSNDVKLELYALYKCITVSRRPQTPRPSLFDFTSRAKWDAWDTLGRESDGQVGEKVWVKRYLEIARSLGWKENASAESKPSESGNAQPDKAEAGGNGTGIGKRVSVVAAPDVQDDEVENTLHGRVLENNLQQVIALLKTNPSSINAKDEYGYTPLHLATDRGHKDIVAVLLQKGADASIKDPDDYTAVELADLAGHEEIRNMLEMK